MLVLDPSGESIIERRHLAPRLRDLRGKVIWFCDNQGVRTGQGDPDVNPLFEVWRRRLREDHGIEAHHACTDQFTSPYRHGRDRFEHIASRAAAVINGLACCGSGTSAVIHDAIRYEERGVPTVSLITSNVEPYATATMRKLGLENLRYLMTSHRIHVFSLVATREEAEAEANRLYPGVIDALVAATAERD